MTRHEEIAFWKLVATDLSIDIVTPFRTTLDDGSNFESSALVKNFGACKGMVVSAEYSRIEPYAKTLVASGYGYSASLGHSPESYNREYMIEALSDWGWSGETSRKPHWLR